MPNSVYEANAAAALEDVNGFLSFFGRWEWVVVRSLALAD
jgi:hypothetical protein